MSQIEIFELLEYDRSTFRPNGAKEIIPTMSENTVAITDQLSVIAGEFKVLTTEQLNASDFYAQCKNIVETSNHMAECVRTTMLKLFDDTAARIATIDKNSKDYTEDIATSEANLNAALGKINDSELKPVSLPTAPAVETSSAQPTETTKTSTGGGGGSTQAEAPAPTTNLDATKDALSTLTNLDEKASSFLNGEESAERISERSQLIDPNAISAAITSGAFFAGQGISKIRSTGDYSTPLPVTEDTVRSMFEGSDTQITGYEKLENGAIKVTTERKVSSGTVRDTYYLPETLTKDSNAVVYFPGDGGSYDSSIFTQQIDKYGSITEPIVVSSYAYDNNGNMSQTLSNIIEGSGGSIGKLTVAGFSAGGPRAVREANSFQASHPDTQVQYLGVDPYFMNQLTTDDVSSLVSSGAQFTYIQNPSRNDGQRPSHNLERVGVPASNITSMTSPNQYDHVGINKDVITDVIPYIQGYTDSLPADSYQVN